MPTVYSSDVLTLDCLGLKKDGVFKAFAEGLKAESWFGNNLDALYDLLTDRENFLTVDLLHWEEADLTEAERFSFESLFEDAAEELAGRLKIRLIAREF